MSGNNGFESDAFQRMGRTCSTSWGSATPARVSFDSYADRRTFARCDPDPDLHADDPRQVNKPFHAGRYADIAATVAKLPARSLVLDGEVCVFDG
jgi:hypothetical protein